MLTPDGLTSVKRSQPDRAPDRFPQSHPGGAREMSHPPGPGCTPEEFVLGQSSHFVTFGQFALGLPGVAPSGEEYVKMLSELPKPVVHPVLRAR